MRREREKRAGHPSMSTISVGCNSAADADLGHLKAVDHCTGDGSLLDASTCLRSKLDWSVPERGVSSASFASGGDVLAGMSPERERSRLDRLIKEVSSMDNSGILSMSSTKVPEPEANTTLLPTSSAGLLAQTRSSLQASSLGATCGSNYGSSFATVGLDRMCDVTGSENVNAMLAAARDDRSCSSSGAAGVAVELRPQVGRLGHSDLIARARAVGKETADAIERAKAPLERLSSGQWPPFFTCTTLGANDCEARGGKESAFANAQSSRAAPGHYSEAQALSRPSSPRPAALQRPWSAPRSRAASLAQRGVRLSEQPSSPTRMTSSSQRAWSQQPPLSPRPQSSRPDLHWGVTSLHQPSRGREVCFSPRSNITAYPPSPDAFMQPCQAQDCEISMRANSALSVAASEKTRLALLRDISREASPLSCRRFTDRLAGSEFATASSRHSDTANKGPPSPASSIMSARMAFVASSSSDHYRGLIEDASNTKVGMDRFTPRRGSKESLFSGVEGKSPRPQEGTPGRLGGRGALMPTALERGLERCSSSAAPPPLPQLLSASSFSTSSLWGPRESPWT